MCPSVQQTDPLESAHGTAHRSSHSAMLALLLAAHRYMQCNHPSSRQSAAEGEVTATVDDTGIATLRSVSFSIIGQGHNADSAW